MRLSLKINESMLSNRNILVLDKKQIKEEYVRIGFGVEANVYNYFNRYALKIFSNDFYGKGKKRELNRKMKKVESLIKISDPSFCFPIDLIVDSELNKIGYYMNLLALKMDDITQLSDLKEKYKISKDKMSIFKILMNADRAIARIHRKGVIIGDIHGHNIIIDKNNNPRFVDTDNYKYNDYDYDVQPWRTKIYEKHYGKIYNLKDNDIFLYAILVLEFLTGNEPLYDYMNVKDYFKQVLNDLNINKQIKSGLKYIFSDSMNKPYIHEIISGIDPNEIVYIKK